MYALVLRRYSEVLYVPMGYTRVRGMAPQREADGHFYGPYREGAHIRRDMMAMRLPGYIIVGEEIDQIPVTPEQA